MCFVDPAPHPERHRVLVAGAGVAGLEALLALSELARDRVEPLLLAPSDDFVYQPLLVTEPFGGTGALRIGLSRDHRRDEGQPRAGGPRLGRLGARDRSAPRQGPSFAMTTCSSHSARPRSRPSPVRSRSASMAAPRRWAGCSSGSAAGESSGSRSWSRRRRPGRWRAYELALLTAASEARGGWPASSSPWSRTSRLRSNSSASPPQPGRGSPRRGRRHGPSREPGVAVRRAAGSSSPAAPCSRPTRRSRFRS